MPEIGLYCSSAALGKEVENVLAPLLARRFLDYRALRITLLDGSDESGGLSSVSLLILSGNTQEETFEAAEAVWETRPALPVIYVANEVKEVFAALARPFFHVVRSFALEEDLTAALQKAERFTPRPPSVHTFANGSQIVRIRRKDILYVASDRHEITIHCVTHNAQTTETLAGCSDKLKNAGFSRIHKSFLVNLYHVNRLDRDSLVLTNGERLYISRYRYPEVKLELEGYIRRLDFMG